jgi:hypothetical protein
MGYGTSNFSIWMLSMPSVTYGFNIRGKRSKHGIPWKDGAKPVQKQAGKIGYFSFAANWGNTETPASALPLSALLSADAVFQDGR